MQSACCSTNYIGKPASCFTCIKKLTFFLRIPCCTSFSLVENNTLAANTGNTKYEILNRKYIANMKAKTYATREPES